MSDTNPHSEKGANHEVREAHDESFNRFGTRESQNLRTPLRQTQKNSAIALVRGLQDGRTVEIQTSDLGRQVLGSAIDVHAALGPGLLESAYDNCLAHEFRLRGLAFRRQVAVPVAYKNAFVDCAYRVDFVVADQLIVELKAIESILPIHQAQVLTYLRLMRLPQAFLINFNVSLLKRGVRSFLNTACK